MKYVCLFYFKFPVAYKRIGILFIEGHAENIKIKRNLSNSRLIVEHQLFDITCPESNWGHFF